VKLVAGTAPEALDWQLWLAQSPDMPYSPEIHPFKWRGLIEYGSGAIGDMGCHNLDPIFWGLEMGIPTHIEAMTDELTDIAWPRGAKIKYQWKNVPKHGDITLFWYEGKTADGKPMMPPELPELEGKAHSETGFYIRGSEGVLYNGGDQAKNLRILPEQRSAEFLAAKPEKTLPRSVTPGNPQQEWSLAIKQGKPFPWMSQFDYAVPLTELCLLGGLAQRVGKPIEWDSAKLQVVGMPDAAKFIKRASYRAGWDYSAAKI
jgi:predicted dehydrogenase